MYLKKELYGLLKTDESIFDFIQKSALDGLWYWDLEKPENEWMNAKFWTVLGYNPDEMPHKSSAWQEIINQDDLKLATENFTKHCENPNHPYDQIVRYTHKNGSIVWIRCRGMAIRDKNGKPIRMLGAHQDISDIKRSEQELIKANEMALESEEKYRSLYDNAPLSYQSLDENGCFVDVNPMWTKTLGYELKEVIGKWFGDFLHPDSIEHFRENFPAFKKRGHVSDVQFKIRRKDNTYILVSFEGSIGYTPEGKFKNTYCVFKDISDIKQAELALKESESKFRALFEKGPIGIAYHKMIYDSSGKSTDYFFLDANEAYQELTGVDPRGKLVTEAFPGIENDPFDWIGVFGKVARTGKTIRFESFLVPNQRWYDCVGYQNKPDHFVAAFFETTKRKKAEIQLQEINENLVKNNEEIELNNKRLESLFKISQYSPKSIQELLDFALSEAIKLTYSKIGYIYYYDESTKQFMLNSWSKEVMKECKVMNPQTIYELEKTGCWGEAVRQRKPIVINDYHEENPLKKGTPHGHVQLNKFLTIPVFIDNKIVAVCGVANKTTDYDNSDIRQLSLLMDSVWKISERLTLLTELTIAKEKAEESEEKLKSIFRVAPSGIGVVINRTLVEVNPKVCEMTGYLSEELIGKNARILYPTQEDYEFVGREKYKQIAEYGTGTVETRWQRKDGEIINIIMSSTPLDSSDLSKGISFTALDVTERIKAEQELIAAKEKAEVSEEKLIEAQELSHVGSWEYYNDTDTINWSKEMCNIFELSPDLPAPKYSEQAPFYTKESFAKLENAVQNCIQHEIPYEIELDIITTSGAIKQIISKGNVLKEINNKLIGCYGTAQDITERKIIERELVKAKEKAEESELQFRLIYENSKNPIMWTEAKTGKIIACNPASEILTEYESDELIGKSFTCLIPQEQLLETYSKYQKHQQIKKSKSIESQIITKSGKIKDVELSATNVDLNGKEISQAIFIDITSRLQKEKELIVAKEKAEESDRLKSAFLANMSHEIRTPMNGILGFTNLLLNPDLSSKEKDGYIKIVQQSGQRMLNTVNDIVEISKIESGLVSINIKETDINKRLNELERFFKPEAEKKGLNLIVDKLLSISEKNILTDQNKLDSILTNLIKNAIKFTESGTINLGCQTKANVVEFYVKDTGIGIPKSRIEAIFNRFEQADIADTKAFEGSGLGLAIAKSYVEMLEGNIWVESVEGKGSVFYFTIPFKSK